MDNVKYNKLIESIEIKKIELLSLNCHQNNNFESKKKSNIDIGISSEVEEFYIISRTGCTNNSDNSLQFIKMYSMSDNNGSPM